jgi:hypothetical protein
MSDPVSASPRAVHATTAAEIRPGAAAERVNAMRKFCYENFIEPIEQYQQIQQQLLDQVKATAQRPQPNPSQLTVPDIKTTALFQEFLKTQNLSEEEGIEQLKKVIEETQALQNVKV